MISAETAARGRVFLVVVDDTPEMGVALRYAASRARNSGGRVALLHVVEPPEGQEWMALEELMRDEQREEAEELMDRLAAEVQAMTGAAPVVFIREGQKRDELQALVDEDPSISILVLAAGTGDAGPGPLVTSLASRMAGRFRVPITIVPGSLTEAEIEALT